MITSFQRQTILTTERLKLRKLVESDFEDFHSMQSDNRVMQYTTTRPLTKTENVEEFDTVTKGYNNKDQKLWVWAIENEIGDFVGTAAFVYLEEGIWEIGYRLLFEYWNHGYGTEITIGMIEEARKLKEIKEIRADSDIRNTRSINILEKCGFQYLSRSFNETYQCEDCHFKLIVDEEKFDQ